MATKMCQAPCDTRPSMLIANFALANFLHKDHFDPVSWKILEVHGNTARSYRQENNVFCLHRTIATACTTVYEIRLVPMLSQSLYV